MFMTLQKGVQHHVSRMHDVRRTLEAKEKKSLNCDICNFKATGNAMLKKHLKTHEDGKDG